MTTARDALRSSALKSKSPKAVLVEYEGQTYEIRAPSVRARGAILEKSKALDDKKRDVSAIQVLAMIYCTWVPRSTDDGVPALGGDERVFEEADFDSFMDDTSAGGIVDVLSKPALEFLNTSTDRDAAKNG